MKTDRFKSLRVMVVILLILLFFQFELGMSVNLSSDLPQLAPFGFSLTRIVEALDQAGAEALAHAGLGSTLALLLAMTGGILFTLSGFQNDGFSLMMASNFILAFTFHFLQLYLIKPASKSRD